MMTEEQLTEIERRLPDDPANDKLYHGAPATTRELRELLAEVRRLQSNRRVPPFAWTPERASQFVPGASVVSHRFGIPLRHNVQSITEEGRVALDGLTGGHAPLSYCDPDTLIPPHQFTWTRERPTVPGWYWFRATQGADLQVLCVIERSDWGRDTSARLLAYDGDAAMGLVSAIAHGEWAGPIPEPAQ